MIGMTNSFIDILPLGIIIPFYGAKNDLHNYPFLICDGSTFDADEYPLLYARLGTNVLPDMRNKGAMGANPDVAGKAPGNTSNVGDVQKAQLPNIKGWLQAQASSTGQGTNSGCFKTQSTGTIDSGTSQGSNYARGRDFNASLNEADHYASIDHLGDNVYYGDWNHDTGVVVTAGETRTANIRLNWIIKAR